jgi:hypothetical protein
MRAAINLSSPIRFHGEVLNLKHGRLIFELLVFTLLLSFLKLQSLSERRRTP